MKTMIEKIVLVESKSLNPYDNLALEEYLLNEPCDNEIILYLWQNKNTVVIGRNQDCYREALVDKLESEGGFLARRLSGGGAVYHDLGNLNFTFITSKQNHDISKQTDVILHAVNSFNLDEQVVKSGRNDLTIKNKKFSGNAYYNGEKNSYHHGTLMLNTDVDNLSLYLNVPFDKLKSKGVSSVRSRVTNICEHTSAEINIEDMKKRFIMSLADIYNIKVKNIITKNDIDYKKLKKLIERYQSDTWKYNISGKAMPQIDISHRFDWGGINIKIWKDSETEIITDCKVFSDAMNADEIRNLPEEFIGKTVEQIKLSGLYGNDIMGLLR